MRFLLDTHALIWWLNGSPELSATAADVIAEPVHEILVSSATGWEIATKHRLGRLGEAGPLATDLETWVTRSSFVPLPITIAHAQRAGSWEHQHQDPFDRILAAQCAIEDIPIVTRDEAIASFGVTTIW